MWCYHLSPKVIGIRFSRLLNTQKILLQFLKRPATLYPMAAMFNQQALATSGQPNKIPSRQFFLFSFGKHFLVRENRKYLEPSVRRYLLVFTLPNFLSVFLFIVFRQNNKKGKTQFVPLIITVAQASELSPKVRERNSTLKK